MKSVLWVTDPWDTLDHPRDTSLRLAEACLALKVRASWCDVRSIRWEGNRVLVDAREIRRVGPDRASASIELGPPVPRKPSEFARLVYRTDPPVDLAYVHPLQLLALGLEGSKSELVNAAAALLLANEKAEAGLLGPLMPPSRIASRFEDLEPFLRAEGKAVLKPLHEAQSHGVELLDASRADTARTALDRATQGFSRPTLLQRYLPGIHQGELRLWFLNGKLLAAARKLPKQGEFKIDMDQGGSVAVAKLSAADKRAALRIGARLRARRIRMAAVDLIDRYVTDYNVTSPGLIVQMERALGVELAPAIVKSLISPWK